MPFDEHLDGEDAALLNCLIQEENMTLIQALAWSEKIIQSSSELRNASSYWVEYKNMPPWKVHGLDLRKVYFATGKASECFAAAMLMRAK